MIKVNQVTRQLSSQGEMGLMSSCERGALKVFFDRKLTQMFYFSYTIFGREAKEDDHHESAWEGSRATPARKIVVSEIANRTGLSRNTVHKWLRSAEEVAEPAY